MSRIERDLERIRELLGRRVRESGVTHQQIETSLGWDRGHVGELVAGTEPLYVDEILLVLGVIRVPPEDFWGEVYASLKTKQASGNGR